MQWTLPSAQHSPRAVAFARRQPPSAPGGWLAPHVTGALQVPPGAFQRWRQAVRARPRIALSARPTRPGPAAARRRVYSAALPSATPGGQGSPEPLLPSTTELALSSVSGSDSEDGPASSTGSSSYSSIDAAAGASSGGEEGGAAEPGSVQIDLELPRRSLLVTFTCNLCGGRTERLVNPIAWERGMVIAQCANCEAWHKLADAANLVEEIRYADLEDASSSSAGSRGD